ncbi:MAG: hypothetical protein NZ901_01110 [Geminocystis sp.]|nr:hypothetical protein [Geminocystis sp.]MCS7146766.1 hypothetical protein [Geminocystis sp.]MCX8077084.1 hypothetical protein [Geminocystis sp.]MDW8115592.1 hypothetical protein [Geminocystis sp.]MDW8463134.1 hypothetical protein [Geminocystis sp.]
MWEKDHGEGGLSRLPEEVTEEEIEKLHRLTVYGRWVVVIILWLLLMPPSLWRLRETIALCLEYCTWSAIRIGLEFHPWATLGISFCVGILTATLVWQSLNILRGGLSPRQKLYLTKQILRIRRRGSGKRSAFLFPLESWLYRYLYKK